MADTWDAKVVEALAELRGARGDYDHSPNTDNALTVLHAEERLNRLLDRGEPKREAVKSR